MRNPRGSKAAGLAGKARVPTVCLAGLLLVAAAPAPDGHGPIALAAEQETTIEVSLRDGLLSVSLREAPLGEVAPVPDPALCQRPAEPCQRS